ncbi:hypothetical protein N9966_00885 [bacterium]|jgi:hypothetical protein|nr:hypothetical protein [bacterium]
MAEKRKSLIDEALLESKEIEKAFETNAKEILGRTMGSEIEEMVKETLEGKDSVSLNEDEDDEETLELLDLDDASSAGEEDLDIELGDEEMDDMEDMGDMEDMDSDELEIVDLTDEDDDTVVNVFKKMADEDEIEVVQTGDGVEIKDNETGAEYKIELGGDSEMEMDDEDMEDMGDMEDMDSDEIEMDDEDMDSDEIEYQIELDGDDEDSDEMDDDMSEGDYMEDGMEENRGAHTLGNASRIANRKSSDINSNRVKMGESKKPKFLKLVNENKVLKNKISSVVSESETLKEDYNKMVDALKQFRNKLNEVAVFNSNLTYSVRLFTENTTTKDEKLEIIKRFDDAKTLKESKGVYKSLIKEISKKEPIKESIDVKLNESKSSGSATEITESKVYVDPQIEKMKKLWSYEYKN